MNDETKESAAKREKFFLDLNCKLTFLKNAKRLKKCMQE